MIRFCLAFWLLIASSPLVAVAPFVVYSCPKCGTHLMMKALKLMLGMEPLQWLDWELNATQEAVDRATRSGCYLIAHKWPTELLQNLERKGWKVVLQLRDPRDHLVSVQHWFRDGHRGPSPVRRMRDPEAQFDELITGARYGWRATERAIADPFHQVTSLPKGSYFIARFEDLVGEKGGGDREVQIHELARLAAFLEIELSRERLEEIADQLFGGTLTFRKGQIGEWRTHFLPHQVELFNERYRPLLLELGYELN